MSDDSDFVNKRAVSGETMLSAIARQADLVGGAVDGVQSQVRRVVDEVAQRGIQSIYVTGCGDSLYAALASRLAFDMHSGCRMEPVEALEFSRYIVGNISERSAVIGVSAGGNKSRTIEAMRRARAAGALTIALTGKEGTAFARETDLAIHQNEADYRVPAPAGEGTFKIGNYVASIVSLYVVALDLGVSTGRLDPGGHATLVNEVRRAGTVISRTIQACADPADRVAKALRSTDGYHILGGGPSYATALFMAAKMFELPQRHGVPVELEEWAHEQFFITRPGTQVIFIVPPGASRDRAHELIRGAKAMGAHVTSICDSEDLETQAISDTTCPIVGALPEEFSPLTYCVPGQLLATSLSRALGNPAFKFISNKQYETNVRLVAGSQIK
ncbi:MAG TPA: SIS domain-containing protein [Candidatus Limnocylindria bacterium]|nr:SIS domain-containing protein [Candidatus Limnocylindria bacterium]